MINKYLKNIIFLFFYFIYFFFIAITTTVTHFDEDNYIIKFPNFIKEVDLYTKNKSNKSIIENNKCIIGLYTRYYESGN